ncbi:substrate import-associated zinc metallohydrolase lipoprotein [Sphingobacterium detergens]|uniref:Substrate import-associated zinc metallohydrolase lipoprotein n=1 Tax=Sphingobacterium detergens TaxID=1145106 RepID=A0A420AXN6_SPHD1|nr:substrate import-associated zinc metallohydrolase lipoprotein [Sphingobacterium detergens]RKE49284.1 substrate import-associated zinc metallohydrolase lipoprotein [Sphingobacterium detergens]
MKTITKIVTGISLVGLLFACNKEDKLNYKLQNYDTFTPGAIDDWITKNLTDPYNIEVVYRYQRNMHDINKNIAPADESKVIPQMDIVKKGFLEIYGKVGGVPFIKTYTPKQFALFGSGDYDPDGSVKGGTADGGRRITLYGLNGLNETNPGSVLGNLQVIHHEFTHIINQNRFIPPEFEKVCVGDYYANWTSFENTPAVARALGFVTPYSRKSVGEDFAEVLSHLVVRGQLFYDSYAYGSGATAYPKFKQKEVIVRDYMTKYFNIDVTQLQMEFQRVMEENYKSTEFKLPTLMSNNYVGWLDWDYRNSWGLSKQISAKQKEVLNPILDELGGWTTKSLQFRIVSSAKATLNITFGDNSNTYSAAIDFNITKQVDNTFKFVKSTTQGTGGAYDNAKIDWVVKDVTPLINYLGNTNFVLDWHTPLKDVSPQEYLKFMDFKDSKDPNAIILGQIIERKF